MLFSYFIYFFLTIFFFSTYKINSLSNDTRIINPFIFIPILITSITFAFRFEVGTDWNNYKFMYENIPNIDIFNSEIEFLFLLLNKTLYLISSSPVILFFTISIIQLTLIFRGLKDFDIPLYIGFFFLFTSGSIFLFNNIVRQALAFCIFFISLKYLTQRKLLKYLFLIAIASLFHYSSLILFPLYLLGNKKFKFLDSIILKVFIFFVSFFIFGYIIDIFVELLSSFISNAKYLRNLKHINNSSMTIGSGLGILSMHFVDLTLILYSKTLSIYFSKYKLNILFRVYIVGIFLFHMFGVDLFLSRVSLNLINLRFLFISFAIIYIVKKWKTLPIQEKILLPIYIGLYSLTFYMSISSGAGGCSPFKFIV